jgi:putative FmdB family regulatory protein
MPIYEYKCRKCGEKFERRLGFSHDKRSLKCPKCGEEDPDRLFSPFATCGSSDGGSYSPHNGSCSSTGFS